MGVGFLHLRNTTLMENLETVVKEDFSELQKIVERGEYITFILIWVEVIEAKGGGNRKLEGGGGSG